MNIPKNIDEVLVDEVYLESALALLKEALTEQKAAMEAAKATRTPFGFLKSLAGKSGAKGDIRAAEEQLRKTFEAFTHTENLHKKLEAQVQNLAESHIRETDRDFSRGLDSCSHASEWLKALDRYEGELRRYLTDIGQTRNTAVAGYDHARKMMSIPAGVALDKAIKTAASLEQETISINRFSDEHKERIRGTPVASTELPKIPTATYREWTNRLKALDLASLLAECERIIGSCESLAGTGIASFRQLVKDGIARKKDLSNQYALSKVGHMRQFVRSRGIDLSAAEERIARIEGRFSNKGSSWSVGF